MKGGNEDTVVVNTPSNITSKLVSSHVYFDCGTRDTIRELLGNQSEEEEDGLDDTMTFSDLSDPSRTIWIVTTAALPWRTGTAVNPFLRALYFVRRRLHLYKVNNETTSKENTRKGKVTLVIPWLLDLDDAQKLYGDRITQTGQEGKEQQLEWIKNYADEKCNMKEEMEYLDILFYNAAYWPAFGSIFPTVDICSLIPGDEADVAILEEPEHLNWMRVPDFNGNDVDENDNNKNNDAKDKDNDNADLVKKDGEVQHTSDSDTSENGDSARNSIKSSVQSDRDEVTPEIKEDHQKDDQASQSSQKSEQQLNELGWAHKFHFVVGVIHTNYTAYMKQYGIGTTIVAAPVINALSSMVVRAYCHKVIRLSGVIPSYAKWKEVTCNVHGVRGDFLARSENSNVPDNINNIEGQTNNSDKEDEDCAPIYFIGKLLWAKGFDKMLKVQESFRKAHPNKEYFPIDVYGGGPDEIEIKRAFHGRLQLPKTSPLDSENVSVASGEVEGVDTLTYDLSQGILATSRSIRSELLRLSKSGDESMTESYSNAKNYINAGFEVVVVDEGESASPSEAIVMERRELVNDKVEVEEIVDDTSPKRINPISILSDVSEKSISTGIATTKAVKNLADSALKAGLAMTFTQQDELSDSNHGDIQPQLSYRFDPPKTIYELRRTPLPARFLGVKDHAMLREMKYKIFLNPSITEVLCTTTAEALAMGKFAIIPKHASNEFFLQFTNCLAYETLRECVKMIQWALDNEPSPLTEEEAHIFTWGAATDRMIKASIVTKREARDRNTHGFDKADSRMAWIHSQGGKKSSFIKTTFFGQTVDKKDDAQREEIASS